MVPKRKIIIDSDPGVDDILAMLLAFSASPEELEVLLISLTFGNIDVPNCLRNAVSLFHTLEKEIAWRTEGGKDVGFETLRKSKPIVAVGAEEPLADQLMMADYFHGVDGLGGIHASHPHLTPAETWKTLFDHKPKSAEDAAVADASQKKDALFKPSQARAHDEILRLLRENEKDTITIEMYADLSLPKSQSSLHEAPFRLTKATNTSLRTALILRNQITPVAEFNTYADSVAAARVYALTSPRPNSTMPPAPPAPAGKQSSDPPPPFLAPYPDKLSRQLNVTIFPLDITTPHKITRGQFKSTVRPLIEAGSPLAEWASAFLDSTFAKIESLTEGISGDTVGLELHDPLCIWYALTKEDAGWQVSKDEDIRIETTGQWTRGMCVVDGRNRRRRDAADGEGERPGDTGNWLGAYAGNRLGRCVRSPGTKLFAPYLLRRVFGVEAAE
ncbi:hypothetical protein MBLNU459_g6893t2 [Dothideomycetes sp. NU459]